jgi:hypothetical protein
MLTAKRVVAGGKPEVKGKKASHSSAKLFPCPRGPAIRVYFRDEELTPSARRKHPPPDVAEDESDVVTSGGGQ